MPKGYRLLCDNLPTFGLRLGGAFLNADNVPNNEFLGLIMGAAQIAGAQVGSRLAMKGGARIIKPLLVIIRFMVNPPVSLMPIS